jgi:membrane-bound metal-dependent hydrolase YbcI (DUF457 family)
LPSTRWFTVVVVVDLLFHVGVVMINDERKRKLIQRHEWNILACLLLYIDHFYFSFSLSFYFFLSSIVSAGFFSMTTGERKIKSGSFYASPTHIVIWWWLLRNAICLSAASLRQEKKKKNRYVYSREKKM